MLSINESHEFLVPVFSHFPLYLMTRYTARVYYQEEVLHEINGDSLERLVPVILNLLNYKSVGSIGQIVNNATKKIECSYYKRGTED